MNDNLNCVNAKLPFIDFSKNTLLGKYVSGRGCNVDFKKKVNNDDVNKKMIYTISVIEEGVCKKLASSMNWIVVPKLPSNYKVESNFQNQKD